MAEIYAIPEAIISTYPGVNTSEQTHHIFVGDFNSDCTYFNEEQNWPTFFEGMQEEGLNGFVNMIDDSIDTTFTVIHETDAYIHSNVHHLILLNIVISHFDAFSIVASIENFNFSMVSMSTSSFRPQPARTIGC